MFQFIKQSNLVTIKMKLILLYLLNISHIVLTLILIETGVIIEANPLLAPIINHHFFNVFS